VNAIKKRPVAFYCANEDEAQLLFLHSANQARRTDEWETIERRPEYDCFAELGFIPDGLLFQDGWSSFCWECDRTIDSDCWDYEEDVELHPVFEGQRSFCSEACCNGWHEERRRRRELKAEAIALVTNRYPGSVIESVSVGLFGPTSKQRVEFSVPGVAGVVWDSAEPDFVLIRKYDLEDWQAYKASLGVAS
jgi:hypothetical protein